MYIPAVPGSTRSEIAQQHLGIRNFLAWVTGLALVGSHLGGEIVTLFQNLVANRPGGTDCVKDLLAYIEYAGYLDIVAQPNHALAMLYVSEFLHHDDLYTRAFVHCVGMGERLYHSTEYMVSHGCTKLQRSQLTGSRKSALLHESLSGQPDKALKTSCRTRLKISAHFWMKSYPIPTWGCRLACAPT